MVLAYAGGLPQWGSMLTAASAATALRVAAVLLDWRLPARQAGVTAQDHSEDLPQH